MTSYTDGGLDRRTVRAHPATLIAFAITAGWLDALTFLHLGKVFTSFQSGNLIFLGLGIGGGGAPTGRAAISLAAFVAASAVAGYLPRLALALEWSLLVLVAILWPVLDPAAHDGVQYLLIVIAAAAMGIQGTFVLGLRLAGIATNAMTATLNLLGSMIGLRARGAAAEPNSTPLPVAVVAGLTACYVVSAILVAVIGRPDLIAIVPAVTFAPAAVLIGEHRRVAAA